MKGVIYRKKTAQSFMEYVLLLVVVTAALFLMLAYSKRALQGRLKEAADPIGEFYSPKNMSGNLEITSNSTSYENTLEQETSITASGNQTREENVTFSAPSEWSSVE